tara:strand:- start:462 stop:806 length:345 start_codon:yes stop_codon:yes gene_type:complete
MKMIFIILMFSLCFCDNKSIHKIEEDKIEYWESEDKKIQNPELKKLLEQLTNDFKSDKEILKKEYKKNIDLLKLDYKERRREIKKKYFKRNPKKKVKKIDKNKKKLKENDKKQK